MVKKTKRLSFSDLRRKICIYQKNLVTLHAILQTIKPPSLLGRKTEKAQSVAQRHIEYKRLLFVRNTPWNLRNFIRVNTRTIQANVLAVAWTFLVGIYR